MNTRERIRVLHLVTGLNLGGAEHVLSQVVRGMNRDQFDNSVISITDFGAVAEEISADNIDVAALNFSRGVSLPKDVFRLMKAVRAKRPHIIQTWMYHADLLGGLTAMLMTRVPVIWNLRQSTLDETSSKKSLLLIIRICAWISRWIPKVIVCGSYAACDVHSDKGYNTDNMQILANGFDTFHYAPDASARQRVIKKLGLKSDNLLLVGMSARYNPQKDHSTFFAAAAIVRTQMKNVQFLLSGEGVDTSNTEIAHMIDFHRLRDCVHLLGLQDEMAKIYPALDIAVLSSAFGEGAPNVVGEAMASGVPCLATDVGDSARMIGDTGIVVEPKNAALLAEGMIALLSKSDLEKKTLRLSARERIQKRFLVSTMIDRYENLYRRVFSQHYDSLFR